MENFTKVYQEMEERLYGNVIKNEPAVVEFLLFINKEPRINSISLSSRMKLRNNIGGYLALARRVADYDLVERNRGCDGCEYYKITERGQALISYYHKHKSEKVSSYMDAIEIEGELREFSYLVSANSDVLPVVNIIGNCPGISGPVLMENLGCTQYHYLTVMKKVAKIGLIYSEMQNRTYFYILSEKGVRLFNYMKNGGKM